MCSGSIGIAVKSQLQAEAEYLNYFMQKIPTRESPKQLCALLSKIDICLDKLARVKVWVQQDVVTVNSR